jgi:hypothetical protein
MQSFYELWETTQSIPSFFGTPGPSFPVPPPLWQPDYMEMYPKDAMQASRKTMEKMWPGSSRTLEPVSKAIANYVYHWSLAHKNTYKRVISNAGERGRGMQDVLTAAKKADQLSQGFKPQYPNPVPLPSSFQHILQMMGNQKTTT